MSPRLKPDSNDAGMDRGASRGGTGGESAWRDSGRAYADERFPPEPDPVPTTNDDGRSLSVDQLRMEIFRSVRTGLELHENIYDESGVLLLAAGSRITPRFLQLLRDRRISRVRLSTEPPRIIPPAASTLEIADDGRIDTPQSRELDRQLAGELQKPVTLNSVKGWRRPRLPNGELLHQASRALQRFASTSAVVTDICEALRHGRAVSATELRRAVSRFVSAAATDFDLLPLIVAMQTSGDEYLYDHCVNVALLSMAMASQLGMEHEKISVIGLGGMLHDIGMTRVPESIRLSPDALEEREWREIHRHPLHTLDMLSGMRGLPTPVKFIAYQIHEREDGEGYPRSRSGRHLHVFAKLVSIADMYAAMTRVRPYRAAMLPYLAAKTILFDGACDRLDRPLVRAFLDTVSMFPTGSRVTLSTGVPARVLRANPGLHTKPVVEELTADGVPTGHIINLTTDGAPRVIQAL